jgi:hypothetical protein
VLLTIVDTFVETDGTGERVINKTLERRWGPMISTRGHSHGNALCTRKRSVRSPGLRWIVMAVVITVPWTTHRWALPFVRGLTTTRSARVRPRAHVTRWSGCGRVTWSRWCPTLPITLLGETASSIPQRGLECRAWRVRLLTSFHLDAALHERSPEGESHTIGRSRVVGARLPFFEQILAAPRTTWQRLTLSRDGPGERTRDPLGKRPPRALCSTNQGLTTEPIVRTFLRRCSLETTFEERRAHVGITTHRQWSDRASDRTTPLLVGLSSPVLLFGHARHPEGGMPVAHTAWPHTRPPFIMSWQRSDASSAGDVSFSTSPPDPDVVVVPRLALDRVARVVCS